MILGHVNGVLRACIFTQTHIETGYIRSDRVSWSGRMEEANKEPGRVEWTNQNPRDMAATNRGTRDMNGMPGRVE